MPRHVYYGEWDWKGDYWGPPIDSMPNACFDLRGQSACTSPGFSTGKGIFVYPQLVAPHPKLLYLGERGAAIGTIRKAVIKTELGLGENIAAATVGDMVAELFLQHADPMWDTRWGRLRGRDWKLCDGVETWKEVTWKDTDPQWLLVLESLRAEYQTVKAETLAERFPPSYHLRYLTALMEQYRIINYEDVTQDSRERPLPHSTTFTETWPTASTDITTGQDQPWAEAANDSEVASVTVNRLRNVTAGECWARCDTVLASMAHFHQCTAMLTGSVTSSSASPATRFDSSAIDCYWYRHLEEFGTGTRFFKEVANVSTSLSTATDAGPAANTDYVLKLTSKSDNTHTCTRDGTAKITDFSNADIPGSGKTAVRIGVRLNSGTTVVANVYAHTGEDLAGGTLAVKLAATGGLAGVGGLAGKRGGLAG